MKTLKKYISEAGKWIYENIVLIYLLGVFTEKLFFTSLYQAFIATGYALLRYILLILVLKILSKYIAKIVNCIDIRIDKIKKDKRK